MKNIFFIIGIVLSMAACSPKTQVQEKDEAAIKQDQKMKWWREARFGMFIHWGLYAQPAGEWNGKRNSRN